MASFANWSPFLNSCLTLGFCKCTVSVLLKSSINTFPSSFDVSATYYLLIICCYIWTSATVSPSWEKGMLFLFCMLLDNPYILFWVKLMWKGAFGLLSLTNIQFKGSNCQSQKFTIVRILLKKLFTPNENLVQMLQE